VPAIHALQLGQLLVTTQYSFVERFRFSPSSTLPFLLVNVTAVPAVSEQWVSHDFPYAGVGRWQKCVEPSEIHLRSLMREFIMLGPEERAQLKKRARDAALNRYSRHLSGLVASVRLSEIVEAWHDGPPRLRRHWGPPDPFADALDTVTFSVLDTWPNLVSGKGLKLVLPRVTCGEAFRNQLGKVVPRMRSIASLAANSSLFTLRQQQKGGTGSAAWSSTTWQQKCVRMRWPSTAPQRPVNGRRSKRR